MNEYITTKNSYEKSSRIFIEQWQDTNRIDSGKIETFISLIPPKAKILDVGAGFGKDVHYLCQKGFDCIGIDFCDGFIEQSKQLYDDVTICKMNFLTIDFAENSFDALWSRGALFHISKKDFRRVIQKLSTILRSEGIFYIQLIEGNNNSMIESIGTVEGAAYYAYYTPGELNAIMGEFGFVLIQEYPEKGWLNYYYKLINDF